MKNFSSVFAAIVLVTTAQMASAGATDGSAPSPSMVGQKRLPKLDSDDMYKFSRTYDLANGKSLTLFSRLDEMYAVVDGGTWHMLDYEGKNTFVSKDKMMTIHVDIQKDGLAKGDLYLSGESVRLASEAAQGEKVALTSHP
jgi:hypothetical protein